MGRGGEQNERNMGGEKDGREGMEGKGRN